MRIWRRYLLYQLPGWVLMALLLWGLHQWVSLPLWIAAILCAIYVGKDFLLYPILRPAYELDSPTGVEQLIGLGGTAQTDLDPEGYIWIQGELWRARAMFDTQAIPSGSRVHVLESRELTLVVAPVPTEPARTSPASPAGEK